MVDSILDQLLYQLNHQTFKNGNREIIMTTLIKNLNKIDFLDKENRLFAEKFVSEILSEKIGQRNETITEYQAVAIHYIITKCACIDQGINTPKLNYHNRTPEDSNTDAYYNNTDGSLNFFYESICDQHSFLKSYSPEKPPEKGGASRLDYFNFLIFSVNHEVQHAKQFSEMAKLKTAEDLTPELYLMMNQHVARILYEVPGTKYQSKIGNTRSLYSNNHNEFFYELDADRNGYKQSLIILEKLCPKAYEIAIGPNNNYQQKLAKVDNLINNYEQIDWKDDTNPNNSGVRADHKTALIIDTVVPLLRADSRNKLFIDYPSLLLTHKQNGKRKSLDEVEKEWQSKLADIIENDKSDNKAIRLANIDKLYETVIEKDPTLLLEKTLRHIAKITKESDSYVTDSGKEIKFSNADIYQEINASVQKAKTLISYIEEVNAEQVYSIIAKYKKVINSAPIKSPTQLDQFELKKRAIWALEDSLRKNRAIEGYKKQQQIEAANKRDEKEKAIILLKKVFPGLDPMAETGTINSNGQIILRANEVEKFILLQNYIQFMKLSPSAINKKLKSLGINTIDSIKKAIETVYPFGIAHERYRELLQKLQNGELELLPNTFEINDSEQEENNS